MYNYIYIIIIIIYIYIHMYMYICIYIYTYTEYKKACLWSQHAGLPSPPRASGPTQHSW